MYQAFQAYNISCLKLRLGGSRPVGEDVEDDAEPIEHGRAAPLLREPLLLRAGQGRVDEHSVGVGGADRPGHLDRLAAAEEKLGVHAAKRHHLRGYDGVALAVSYAAAASPKFYERSSRGFSAIRRRQKKIGVPFRSHVPESPCPANLPGSPQTEQNKTTGSLCVTKIYTSKYSNRCVTFRCLHRARPTLFCFPTNAHSWPQFQRELLLRGTTLNRTYGTPKNLYISQFLQTIFGPIYYQYGLPPE